MTSRSLLPVSSPSSINHPPPSENNDKAMSGIPRTFSVLIALFISVLFVTCYTSMISPFPFGPKAPSIQLRSLSLSNLNVSRSKLAANWLAEFTVSNPNMASEIHIDGVESVVYYRSQNAVSVSSSDGFYLGVMQDRKNVSLEFATTGDEGDQPVLEYPVLREIKKDEERGMIAFGVTMNAWGTYKMGWINWSRNFVVNGYCLGLTVRVDSGSGTGRLMTGDELRNCIVYMDNA